MGEDEDGGQVFEGVRFYTGKEVYMMALDADIQLTYSKAEERLRDTWEIQTAQ